MGQISSNDVLILISLSGETDELKNIIKYAKQNKILLIGIVSNKDSILYKSSNIKLLIPEVQEAGYGIVTTSSKTEQLYLGATIGIPTIDYYERSTYNESEFEDTINGLQGFDFQEELSVYGSGLNVKLGAIFRVSEILKLGAALHTPTTYSIEEMYNTSLTTYSEWKDKYQK